MTIVRRVEVCFDDEEHDFEITLPADATVRHLVEVLGLEEESIVMNGRRLSDRELIASIDLVDGSRLTVRSFANSDDNEFVDAEGTETFAVLDRVAGFPAGSSEPLFAGPNLVSVGASDAMITIEDESISVRSERGNISVGGRSVRAETPVGEELIGVDGALHMTLRDVRARPDLPPARPVRAPLGLTKPSLRWKVPAALGLIASVLVFASIFGPPLLLAGGFVCGTGAVLAFFREVQQRRSVKTRNEFTVGQQRTQFARDLRVQAEHAAATRRNAWPSIPSLTRSITDGSSAVSPGSIGEVVLGYGTTSWKPDVEALGKLDTVLQAEVDGFRELANVPITVDLGVETIGIYAEDTVLSAAVARALVAQASGLYARRLSLGLLADTESIDRWDWLKWSHLLHDDGVVFADLSSLGPSFATSGPALLVVDADETSHAAIGLTELLARDFAPKAPFGPIVVCRTPATLARCSVQLRIESDGLAMLRRSNGISARQVTPHTVSRAGAAALARAMLRTNSLPQPSEAGHGQFGVRPYHLRDLAR